MVIILEDIHVLKVAWNHVIQLLVRKEVCVYEGKSQMCGHAVDVKG